MSHIPAFADLQIRLFPRQAEGYPLELTLDSHLQFDRAMLPADFLPFVPSGDGEADGQALFDWLMVGPGVATAWAAIRARQPQCRIRLIIDKAAPELHALPWELLRESQPGHTSVDLAASGATPFSRYMAGTWQPGRPVIARPIRILAAIASPTDLDVMGLPAFDLDHEWENLSAATQGLDVETVCLRQPTLAGVEAALRDGGYHVLHIIAHGGYDSVSGHAFLALCDDAGKTATVEDTAFAEMLTRLMGSIQADDQDRLRLVYLDSCETATRDSAHAFRGFAPVLVGAGVPAVVAMQEAVAVETSQVFTATFYKRLLAHGLADLASNEARATLLTRKLPGAAIPVLFMRLQGGLLFGKRGQILGQQPDSFWETLLENIADQACIPFLGPGVTADLLPNPEDLAHALATKYGYPFQTTGNLPRVAQFIGTVDNRRLRRDLIREMVEGFQRKLQLTGATDSRRAELSQVIARSDWVQRSVGLFETEIHQQVADLGLPLYFTTNYDNLMAEALAARGRTVRQETVAWRDPVRDHSGRPHGYLDPEPSPEEPVVVHLFGNTDDPLSMVLTEDDHLDFLTLIARDHEFLLPTNVRASLAESTLLFLGYRLTDLDMKVIMRGLLTNLDLDKWGMLHVAVQLDEEQVDESRVNEVTRYFQKYFAESKIDVYWGNVQQFVTELHDRWQEAQHG